MIKVHIAPWYDEKESETGGIRRVVDAMRKYLPLYGIEPVRNPKDADIINNHGAMLVTNGRTPIVHTGHGFYWFRQRWGANYQEVNDRVIESMRHAVAHTSPSEWVATSIRRGGLWYPHVVYHGVDVDEFPVTPREKNAGYVLWNKARADWVSDPQDMQTVAALCLNHPFVSTIGEPAENVKITGPTSYAAMKELVANAGVYLATARETFGIGTIEAMSCGVPVAGWDWGGQSEIIKQGETGYLAPPGDFAKLAECIELCYQERDRLSKNAAEDVRDRWGWEHRVEQYADIFKQVHGDYNKRGPKRKISILVTAHNLDKYLPDCLRSVQAQTHDKFECLVIDDAQSEATKMIVEEFAKEDKRIKYVPTPHNMGLASARNFGASKAQGLYLRHLDADDMLAPNAVALEAEYLDKNQGTHIVYGHLEVIGEDGSRQVDKSGDPVRSGWPPDRYSWREQMAHLNQLPSCVMMRREVHERSGGYRHRMRRNEDAEFWCRVTSLGFRAEKITQAVTYYHRHREDSKGALEWKNEGGEPDWTAWFPWRMGATNHKDAVQAMRQHHQGHPHPYLVPFGAQGKPPKDLHSWYVMDHSYPVVSVIVTCGPGHEIYLLDALDSLWGQEYPDWECIVVNDTGKDWDDHIKGAPWAKVVNTDGNVGASAARNHGYLYAKGKLIVWMDADDFWLPQFLDTMVSYAEKNDGIIFSDLLQLKEEGIEPYTYEEFNCQNVAKSMRYPGSSVLIPRYIVEDVMTLQSGWDVEIPGMEDWDFQIAMHHLGACAYHVPQPLFVYRMYSSTKRETDYARIEEIKTYVDEKWREYRFGEKQMSCGCGKKIIPPSTSLSKLSASGNLTADAMAAMSEAKVNPEAVMVEVEYVGPMEQNFSIRSRIKREVTYRFGNNEHNRRKMVLLKDAEQLISKRDAENRPHYVLVDQSIEVVDADKTQRSVSHLG